MIWFVVPCLGRFDMTNHTLGRLSEMRDEMELRVVVVANDDNLSTARKLGFDYLVESGPEVGRKFNDGYSYALEHGADYVVHYQSDNEVTADYFRDPPGKNEIISGHYMAMKEEDRTAFLWIEDKSNPYGAGPFYFPARLLKRCNGRPIEDELHNGVDGNLVKNLLQNNRGSRVVYRDLSPMQFISYKDELSINSYDELKHLVR